MKELNSQNPLVVHERTNSIARWRRGESPGSGMARGLSYGAMGSRYRPQWLAKETIAGVPLTACGIPVSLAHTSLPGLPGLFASLPRPRPRRLTQMRRISLMKEAPDANLNDRNDPIVANNATVAATPAPGVNDRSNADQTKMKTDIPPEITTSDLVGARLATQ